MTNTVTREDIEDAAPPALTIHMEGVGTTGSTNCWTSSHWPAWWQPETTYCFSDGRELEEGEAFPPNSIQAKDWKREYGQQWDCKKSLKDNLIERENHAYFNAQLWMTNCFGLNLETLYAIAAGEEYGVAHTGDRLPRADGIVAGHSCLASRAQGMAKSL